jgi:CheY-like chemotaxis protein
MVVEDEPDLYEMVLALYGMLGVNGVAFRTGEEALAWIDDVDSGQFVGELPELALLDIRLPGDVSGTMIGARLRQSRTLSHMGIILMTAYRLSFEEEQAIVDYSGCDRLMYKPLPKINSFQRTVSEILLRRRK